MKSLKVNKIEISKVYENKKTRQLYLLLPRKKMTEPIEGKKIVVSYW